MPKKKKFGLALSAGAYRGFAHIGVIKSLVKHDLTPDYISGCSIGSLIAAHYALYQDVERLESDMLYNKRDKRRALLDVSRKNGIISGNKFTLLLDKYFGSATFADTKIPLSIMSANIINGQPYIFKTGLLKDAVRASTSIPSLFRPLAYQDMLLVDGGVLDPVPVDLVKKLGAKITIAVNLYHHNEFVAKNFSTTTAGFRSIRMILYTLAKLMSNNADIVIMPDVSILNDESLFNKVFSDKLGQKLINIGEEEANKYLPKITKLLG